VSATECSQISDNEVSRGDCQFLERICGFVDIEAIIIMGANSFIYFEIPIRLSIGDDFYLVPNMLLIEQLAISNLMFDKNHDVSLYLE